MTPADLLASLQSRGFILAVDFGQLLVSPGRLLAPEDAAAIRAHRDDLVGLLCPALAAAAQNEAEARSAALARLPTPWEEGGGEVTPGDVWLVRVSGPGEPPEYAATTGDHLAWLAKSNDAARAAAEKSGKVEKAKARRTA